MILALIAFVLGYFARPLIDDLWKKAEQKEEVNNDD